MPEGVRVTNLTQDDLALAGEYVLGLLDAAGQAQANARIATDPEFASEVIAWGGRFEPLLGASDQQPSAHVWEKIVTQIPVETEQDRAQPSVRIWQGLTALSASVAAVLGLMLSTQPVPPAPLTPAAPLLAALGSDNNATAITARYDRDTGQLLLTPVVVKTGKLYPELWIIPAGGVPQSLGVINGKSPTQIAILPSHRALMDRGATLAITPEHDGGSASGQPTGPIIASGTITTL